MKRSFDQKAILLHARILEDEQATDKESDSDFDFSNDDGEGQALGNDKNTPPMDQSQNAAPPQMPAQDDTGRAAVDALASVAQTLAKGKVANDKSALDTGHGEDLYDQSVLLNGNPNGDEVSDATLNNPLGDEMSLSNDEKQVLEAFRKFKNDKLNERAKKLYRELSKTTRARNSLGEPVCDECGKEVNGNDLLCARCYAKEKEAEEESKIRLGKNILEVGSSNRHENWCDYNKGLSCNCGYSSGEIEWPEEYSNEGDIGLSSKEKRDRVVRNRRKAGPVFEATFTGEMCPECGHDFEQGMSLTDDKNAVGFKMLELVKLTIMTLVNQWLMMLI